jgi:1-acyl-sn-glycerol-3-phosphate acyltransferase
MRSPRRLVTTLLGFLRIWLTARLWAPRLSFRPRARLAGALARRTLDHLGVALRVAGRRHVARDPRLLVANHVSWLDVQVLSALFDARFVAKSETRRWPIVGGIARGFGVFFLRRGSRRDAARVKDAVAAALARGESVVVFPEGTTTDGTALRRFHPAFFQAAIDVGVPVQPIALRYRRPDGSTCLAAGFVDDMTFLESLRNVARESSLTADVAIGPALSPWACERRDLAGTAQRWIAATLRLAPDAVEPSMSPRRRARRVAA